MSTATIRLVHGGDAGEGIALSPALKSRGTWRMAFDRLGRNRLALAGLGLILALALLAVTAPLLAPADPRAQDFRHTFARPSLYHGLFNPRSGLFLDLHSHVFGTDNLGRDWFSRMLYGARLSLSVGVVAQAIVLSIGIPIGLAAGYFGGRVDSFLMRTTDLVYAFPALLLIILLRDATGGGLLTLFVLIGLVSWPTDARLVRGQVLYLREQEFVTAARSLGASHRDIMVRHLLPNCLGPLIVTVTFGIPRAILLEAAMSFIGVGVSPGTPSWGSMIQEGYSAVYAFPYLVIFPAVAIALVMLAFTFFGDGLRDALDPRTTTATAPLTEGVDEDRRRRWLGAPPRRLDAEGDRRRAA